MENDDCNPIEQRSRRRILFTKRTDPLTLQVHHCGKSVLYSFPDTRHAYPGCRVQYETILCGLQECAIPIKQFHSIE